MIMLKRLLSSYVWQYTAFYYHYHILFQPDHPLLVVTSVYCAFYSLKLHPSLFFFHLSDLCAWLGCKATFFYLCCLCGSQWTARGPGPANPVVELEQWWHDQSMLWEQSGLCVCVSVRVSQRKTSDKHISTVTWLDLHTTHSHIHNT